MKNSLMLLSAVLIIAFTACKKDDDNGSTNNNGSINGCLATKIALTQTQIEDFPASHAVNISFDAKNTSSEDYDPATGNSKYVKLTVVVMTTDSATYETNSIMPVSKISAGATTTFNFPAQYGAGKTYKSYTVSKACD